jgi:hypothetical protein
MNQTATQKIHQPHATNLSPDGKWRSFPKVQNPLQYVGTGTFYDRVKADGKPYQ